MMQLLSNLGFRKKLALPIIILALLLLLIGMLGIRGAGELQDVATDLAEQHMPAAVLLLDADRDMYQAFLAERSLILADDPQIQQAIRGEHSENLQQARERVANAAKMENQPELSQRFRDFERQFDQWQKTSSEVVAVATTDRAAAQALTMGRSYDQFSVAREALDQLSGLVGEIADKSGKQAVEIASERIWQQSVAIVLGLVLCVVLVVAFPLFVTRPLDRMLERVRDIAEGDGDLTARIDVRGSDELGQLSDALNRFLERLQGLIREVRDTTSDVEASAGSMASMANENSSLIRQEHASIDQVSTAAAQMSAAIHEVARSAQQAAQASQDAEKLSRESARVVTDNIASMRALAAEVERASEVIGSLEQETNNIGAVLAVIKGIAEQTNLLALNAAIEAARAGEQGRGFAVVADEVRALAARTQESTKDIQEMIERLQSGAQNAVKVMQGGSGRAQESVDRAATVESTLAQAAQGVDSINEMAAHIAAACEQQSSVTEEITRNITEIRDLSDRSAQTSAHGVDSSEQLSATAGRLARLVGRFRV